MFKKRWPRNILLLLVFLYTRILSHILLLAHSYFCTSAVIPFADHTIRIRIRIRNQVHRWRIRKHLYVRRLWSVGKFFAIVFIPLDSRDWHQGRVVQSWVKITQGQCEIWIQIWKLKSISLLILFVYKLIIGSSTNNRENYPRKCFWTQEKETRVKC